MARGSKFKKRRHKKGKRKHSKKPTKSFVRKVQKAIRKLGPLNFWDGSVSAADMLAWGTGSTNAGAA